MRAIVPVVVLLALSACAPKTGLTDPSLRPELTAAKPADVCSAQVEMQAGPMWFRTICPKQMTPQFTSSVQRALEIRGDYAGPINGKLDAATLTAITKYQTVRGLPTSDMSYRMAQQLGLIPWIAN